jgi:hypothetical protein
MKLEVLIENPPVGYQNKTSLARARRFERAGRARFVAPLVIRFLDTPTQAAIVKIAEQRLHARLTGQAYDNVDRSFYRDASNVPVINPAKMLREEKSSRDWSYTAGVRRQMRRDHTRDEVKKIRTEANINPRVQRPSSNPS